MTAQLLLDNNRYRACISRSYYAIYYATQALLASKNLNSRTHRGLIKLFGQHFIKTGELSTELAKALNNTYELRKLSDYDETCTLTREQARVASDCAKVFVDRAGEFLWL
ncbi:MAG: HEPN domain-containing protein [Cyanobacteriota bacterium]|nr:HEPN domain-containing protein [Cyanobacteriota bacterium]